MEAWEDIVKSYSKTHDLRCFTKALKTATNALSSDLAAFEAEWITNTLFYEPVELFNVVAAKRQESSWSKPICDSFKLIALVVDKYSVDHLYRDIVTLCLVPYTASIRKDALLCLAHVAKKSPEAGRDLPRLVADLEEGETSRSPLAVVVGSIAEHHPELVADDIHRIWRVYLNLLESKKNTDTVTASVLQGLVALFKHFGVDLPVVEFRDLYSRVARSYITRAKCMPVCLTMLEKHSGLFKELLAEDRPLRDFLWTERMVGALSSVYEAVATCVTKERLQSIADTELLPRTNYTDSTLRLTALRIVKRLVEGYGIVGHTDAQTDVQALEHELRAGNVTYETADAILWCIETNYLYSEKLLQASLLFFEHIPSTRRRDIVVYGLLNAPDEARTSAVTLLISECCQPSEDERHNIDKYLPLWRDLLESRRGEDGVVAEKGRLVMADVMEYVLTVLGSVADDGAETLPDRLPPLLALARHLLSLCPPEEATEAACRLLRRRLVPLLGCASAEMLALVTETARHCEDGMAEFCKMVRVDKCLDEAALCEASHLLISACPEDVQVARVLDALEILFTRKDVEPSILVRALQRFEGILDQGGELDRDRLNHIIHLVENMRSCVPKVSKEQRILHRDIVIFLGKYGSDRILTEKLDEATLMVQLKNKFNLDILNTDEAITYKLNLQRILHLAVSYEEPEILQKLLAVICVSLSSGEGVDLQRSLTSVLRALCRAHAHAQHVDVTSLQHAVLLCRTGECVSALLTYISKERSPGARKMLSDALEGLLLKDPGSDLTEGLVRVVAEDAAAMMRSGDPTTRSGGLNITDTLLVALKDNHSIQKAVLPELLTLIFETGDLDAKNTFQAASEIFIQNLGIYDQGSVDDLVQNLTAGILKARPSDEIEVRLFKDRAREIAALFVDVGRSKFERSTVEGLRGNLASVLYFVCECRIRLKGDELEMVLVECDEVEIGGDEAGLFAAEAVLRFLEVYMDDLLVKRRQMTEDVLRSLLPKLPPKHVVVLQKHLRPVTAYTEHYGAGLFAGSFRQWYTRHHVAGIIAQVTWDSICPASDQVLDAVCLYLDVLKVDMDPDGNLQDFGQLVLEGFLENGPKGTELYKEHFASMLKLSLMTYTDADLKRLLVQSHEKTGLEFFKCFAKEFSCRLLRKPYVMLDEGMGVMCGVLEGLLRVALKERRGDEFFAELLVFVDAMWPTFEEQSSFQDKLAILALVAKMPVLLHEDTRPVRWALGHCLASARLEEKARLVAVLPGGDGCSASYRSLASHLPVRFAELTGMLASALQALLDAIVLSADSAALDIVTTLADCDPSKGWWDDAMASCVGTLARRKDFALKRLKVTDEGSELVMDELCLLSIATKLFRKASRLVCNRLLIPLLRYSGSSFCESFFADVVVELLGTLARWPRVDGCHELMGVLNDHARAFSLITLALEQIPITALKSEHSVLYSKVEKKQASFLIKQSCKLCVTLRQKKIPDDASDELRQTYRQCQIENFKCLCAAVCLSRPPERFYEFVFAEEAWASLVDCSLEYHLPVRSQWSQKRTLQAQTVELNAAGGVAGTARTRLFLGTLSENPLLYDLLEAPVESNAQQLELSLNELNGQEAAGTLTALVKHASMLTHHGWRGAVVGALVGGAHRNLRWTVAQVVCNCKEDLIPHASVLRPALLAMTADTACDVTGRRTLNSLHLDVLDTVVSWSETQLPSSSVPHLAACMQFLMNTTIDNGHRSVSGTLLSMLKKLVELYVVCGQKEFDWTGYEEHLKEPSKLKYLYQIATVLTTQGVRVPNLVQRLVELDEKYWSTDIALPKLFGLAVSCESERAVQLSLFRKMLARKRQNDAEYVRMLHYTQQGYASIVDEANFKIVVDLAPKLVGDRKSRCLNIIATYLEHEHRQTQRVTDMFDTIDICSLLQDNTVEALQIVRRGYSKMGDRLQRKVMSLVASHCESGDVKVRRAALGVAATVFEGLFGTAPSEPSPKRSRATPSSAMLASSNSPDVGRVVECVSRGVTDPDPGIASSMTDSVAKCLDGGDFGIRLAEAFLVAVCIPSTQNRSLSVCACAFLELVFRGLRNSARFQGIRLSDRPLETSQSAHGPSKLLTKSRTYCGTFLSSSRRMAYKKKETSTQGVDVQIPVTDILGSLLEFAKNKADVSQALCVQVIKSVVEKGRGFDAGEELAKQVCDILSAPPGNVTPLAMEVGRIFLDNLASLPRFHTSLEKLRGVTRCTEGEFLSTLLYEDVQLRGADDLFTLGGCLNVKSEETKMDVEETAEPSLDGLTAAFGRLSRWDQLTLQRRGEVGAGLPQLWVDEGVFRVWLQNYEVTNTDSWFNKLLVTYRDESKRDSLRWLRETDRWPRRHFHVSVVAEAIQSSLECSDDRLCCDIRPGDCLAEWAARLALRRAYSSLEGDSEGEVSTREHELVWCRAANDRALPQLALNCISVNASGLSASEDLSWNLEKARALRTVGLDSNNNQLLEESLGLINSLRLQKSSPGEDVALLNRLLLMLHRDLGSLTNQTIDSALRTIDENTDRAGRGRNKQSLCSLYELAMSHYDDIWEEEENHALLLNRMAVVLGHVIDLNLSKKAEMFLSVILNRLEDVNCLDEATSTSILDKATLLMDNLDEFAVDALRKHSGVFPGESLSRHGWLSRDDFVASRVRRQLALVRDPHYSLLCRCDELTRCDDPVKWKSIIRLLRINIFENPYAVESTEYQVLMKYKEDLYGIEEFETTDLIQRSAVLSRIIEDLKHRVVERKSLRLSQLCPALTRARDSGCEQDRAMSRVLRLGKLSVVKFCEQVSVYTNAVTRPAVLKVVVSDGTTRRFLTKSGESLRLVAACQAAGGAGGQGGGFVGHEVTQLSEDSGLIEFLENTVTVRDLINSEHDIEAMNIRLEKFRVSSSPMERYKTYCGHMPAYTLRSAVEKSCYSTEDFIKKKRRFLETLSGLTLLGSIFGLGDRHLENLLYCQADGALCGVDWAAALQFGQVEPAPARLTRNLLAMVTATDLECHLQKLLSSLRGSHHLFLSVVKLVFGWMGDDFLDKLNYISLFVRGAATTYEITDIELSRCASSRYTQSTLKILADVFRGHTQRSYSVVEQVDCLLRHCTHPLILANTRDGWEPWI